MSFWDKLKPNAVWFGSLAFAAACVSAWLLMKIFTNHVDPPVEILVILATAFGGSIMLLGNLSGQAMTDNPPNHIANILGTVENLAEKLIEKLTDKNK